jgi:hypothetical protein
MTAVSTLIPTMRYKQRPDTVANLLHENEEPPFKQS